MTKINLDLIQKYIGLDKVIDAETTEQEKIILDFSSRIKLGNLYTNTEQILGSSFKPHKKLVSDLLGTYWELTVTDLTENCGLTFDQAKMEVNFVEVPPNSILMAIKFEEDGHLLQILYNGKILWFSSQYLATNATIVTVDNVATKEKLILSKKYEVALKEK
jgi:hypothetical protein